MARKGNDVVCEMGETFDDEKSLSSPREPVTSIGNVDRHAKVKKDKSNNLRSRNACSETGDAGYESELPSGGVASGVTSYRMENEIEEENGIESGQTNGNTDRSPIAGSSAAYDGGSEHEEFTPLLQSHRRTEYNSIAVPHTDHCEREPSAGTEEGTNEEKELRKRLWAFFDSPRRRWIKLRRCSIHVWFQIIKIAAVFGLAGSFGSVEHRHTDFMSKSEIALKHLYFDNWTDVDQPFAIYSRPYFFAHFDDVLNQYNKTPQHSIGPYGYKYADDGERVPPQITITFYPDLQLHPANYTYNNSDPPFQSTMVSYNITPVQRENLDRNTTEQAYDIREFLKEQNHTIHFDNTSNIELRLELTCIYIGNWRSSSMSTKDSIECYDLTVMITYENNNDDGQLNTNLQTHFQPRDCNNTSNKDWQGMATGFCFVVLLLCLISLPVEMEREIRRRKLKKDVELFFLRKKEIELDKKELRCFVNHWERLNMASDIVIIAACMLQLCLTFLDSSRTAVAFNACIILLGAGCLLCATSLIKILDIINENCNIVILALGRAVFSRIVPFLLCFGLLYFGYLVCGWLVLGPYLNKFHNIPVASESIFSLINGDDVFATFDEMRNAPKIIRVVGGFYLYSFLIMFIIVIVNVTVSILSDAYHEVMEKGFYKKETESVLEQFVNEDEHLVREKRTPGCLYPLLKRCWPIKEKRKDGDLAASDSMA